MTMKHSITKVTGSLPAHEHYSSLLMALLPAVIPVAMFLIVASAASLREVRSQTVASNAKSLTAALSERLLSPDSSNPIPVVERVRLNVTRSGQSSARGTALEAERQFAKLLARRMELLNFCVIISVGGPEQLSLAESLAATMIEECPASSDRVALRLDPGVDSKTVEFEMIRTLETIPLGGMVR